MRFFCIFVTLAKNIPIDNDLFVLPQIFLYSRGAR
jgi:hypothetical protein